MYFNKILIITNVTIKTVTVLALKDIIVYKRNLKVHFWAKLKTVTD